MHTIFEALTNAPEGTIFRWTALMLGNMVAVLTIIFANRNTNKKVADVSDQATRAAELAEPTGNGFAKDMRDSMKFLSDAIIRVEKKVDDGSSSMMEHLQDHARNTFKDK